MPKVRTEEIVKFYLPSYGGKDVDDPAWIEIDINRNVADMVEIDGDKNFSLEMSKLIARKSKNWNLTKGDQVLPITAENVQKFLDPEDLIYLKDKTQFFSDRYKLDPEKKEDSSSI